MNYSAVDWRKFLSFASPWRSLSRAARAKLMQTDGENKAIVGLSPDELPILKQAKFVRTFSGGARIEVEPQARKFISLMKSSQRYRLLSRCAPHSISIYLTENFSRAELSELAGWTGRWGYPEAELGAAAHSAEWVTDFLEAPDLITWMKAHGATTRPQAALADAFDETQAFVRSAIEWDRPQALDELAARAPSLTIERLGAVLALATHCLLLFVEARAEDHFPVIDFLGAVGARLRLTPPPAPEAVTPDETFECAFALDDMSALLSAVCRQPVRLRQQDGRIFATDQKLIAADMIETPEWLYGGHDQSIDYRLILAQQRLEKLGLLANASKRRGRQDSLSPSPNASAWLARPRKERLRELLEAGSMRNERMGKPLWAETYDFGAGDQVALNEFVRDALRTMPSDAFWRPDDFLRWRTFGSPALEALRKSIRERLPNVHRRSWTLDRMERELTTFLINYIFREMAPLGAVRLGPHRPPEEVDSSEHGGADHLRDSRAQIAVSLTSAGQFMLGLADDFQERLGQAPDVQIIVQPNFEIAFLGRYPSGEAIISRYAERVGRGVGVLFKLTKASIMAHASGGGAADEVLAELTGLATKGVPTNVEREIRGWFQQCRRVTTRQATLIECHDLDTVARVRSAAGKEVRLITDTLLEFPESRLPPDFQKKLAKAGIFVN